MNLQSHYTPARGYVELVTPATHPVQHIHFGMLRLDAGERHQMASAGFETGLVILSGTCAVQVDDQTFEDLGGRASVFDGRASAVYVPSGARADVSAGPNGAEVAVCRCATSERHLARVVRPEDVVAREVGGPGFRRYVHDIIGPQMPASAMIVGETFTVEGNWSSFPPHKHDVAALPDEVQQEELYFYKLRPEDGFGIQYVYSRPDSPHGPLEQPMALHDNDVTIMPFGYHPVAAPPGYDVYYLWFLAGKTRLMRPRDDPAYAWIKSAPERTRFYPH